MKRECGYTLLEAVVLIAVTSSTIGLATGALVSFARVGRVIAGTSTTVVGLAVLEKTLAAAAANIAAPPGVTVPVHRRSVGHVQSDVTGIEIPYFGGDPCSIVIVESVGRVTRVLLREGAHEQTVGTAPVAVEFLFHAHDAHLVTFRARETPKAAFTVRFGLPVGAPRDEHSCDLSNREFR